MPAMEEYPAKPLIPHRPPMAMVDSIVVAEGERFIRTTIRPDNRFLADGVLDRSAIPELAAQGAAACRGMDSGEVAGKGFLASMRHVVFHSDIRVNDTLQIHAVDESPLDGWYIIHFKIFRECDHALCTEGQMNLCLQ